MFIRLFSFVSCILGATPRMGITPRRGDGKLAATPARDTLGINEVDGETPSRMTRDDMVRSALFVSLLIRKSDSSTVEAHIFFVGGVCLH